ncbi:hypothetical protein NW767_012527 [Fusarium falciforme]|uniref:Uncharacterized protein n=1 Tax=Fusarium falciforme TaxID=195108 RepID=A0A9W8QZT8_9HYPO|nr:hypothetical protein NW755_011515 [Fusarium falciforme]KAJ4186685.1 hypothetical protein NW767_012527 [Fusarium falciforme]
MQAQHDQPFTGVTPTGSTASSTLRVRAIFESGRQNSPRSKQYLLDWQQRHPPPTVSDLSQVRTEDIRSTASQMEPGLVPRKEQQLLDEIKADPEMQASFLLFKQTRGQTGKRKRTRDLEETGILTICAAQPAGSSHQQASRTPDDGQALRAQQLKDANDQDTRQMEVALEQRAEHFKQALAWGIEVHRLNAKIQRRRLEAEVARQGQGQGQ